MPSFTQANRPLALSTDLGDDLLILTQVSGREELGRLFELQLSMQSECLDLEPDQVIGKNATIRLEGCTESGNTRYFNGFLHNFQLVEIDDTIACYQATLVPWLWFLTQTSNCRIFQDLSVPEIIKKIFQYAGFNDFEDRLSGSYPEREYCVQYRETDFNFVTRLMEAAGIYYYFKHDNGKHTLVLADSTSGHDACPGYEAIEFKEPIEGDVGSECVRSWDYAANLLSTIYTHSDFDFVRPNSDLTTTAECPREHAATGLEIFEYPGGYVKSADGDHLANTRIEAIQAGFEVFSGRADAKGMVAGAWFQLKKHAREDQNKAYLITSVTHKIEGDGIANPQSSEQLLYDCTFTAIVKEAKYRLPSTTPKPLIQGTQTAVVVGPAGEEIYVDEYGRVKVQFHWDRYGAYDEKSSCWMRVAQNAAGNLWGSIFTPRVGHEVIVHFFEGDPDQPIISGSSYNGANGVPYELPAHKTVSTIKTSSSKGGGGFNEIRFEDKKDSEQIFIHGQKNLDIIVEHDRKDWIKNDCHQHIGHDEFLLVDQHRHAHVKGNRKQKVEGDDHLTIDGNQHLTCQGDAHYALKRAVKTRINRDHHLKVSGNHNQRSGNSVSIKGGMNVVIEAGMKLSLKVGGNFVDISPAGVAIKGALVLINSGGAAGSVTAPQAPRAAKAPADPQNPA